ncbi:hypothetical protein F1880_008917 [Penicillium rolfsii]|nr:hypothetical protein F1880_008917 [Penicillium rolfsii]
MSVPLFTSIVAHFLKARQPRRGLGYRRALSAWTSPATHRRTSAIDTSKFVVQAQGYNPLTNVFEPNPADYSCKGSSMCTTPDLVQWCDHAVNYLHRDDDPYYNTISLLLHRSPDLSLSSPPAILVFLSLANR